jgi:hypothetical protein
VDHNKFKGVGTAAGAPAPLPFVPKVYLSDGTAASLGLQVEAIYTSQNGNYKTGEHGAIVQAQPYVKVHWIGSKKRPKKTALERIRHGQSECRP